MHGGVISAYPLGYMNLALKANRRSTSVVPAHAMEWVLRRTMEGVLHESITSVSEPQRDSTPDPSQAQQPWLPP